jgi:hypothetical protein
MTDVQFDDSQGGQQHYASPKIFGRPQTPFILKMLVKKGVVQTEMQGFRWMIGIIILAVTASLAILAFTFIEITPRSTPYTEMTAEQKERVPKKESQYIERKLRNQGR